MFGCEADGVKRSEVESLSGTPDEDDSWVGCDRLYDPAGDGEGKETLVDVADVGGATVTLVRLLFGRNWERGASWLVGEVEQRVEPDNEGCCWVRRTGWDSCTGMGRSSCLSVEGQGGGGEEDTGDVEEERCVIVCNMLSWEGGRWPGCMLLSLMSTVIPLWLPDNGLLSRTSWLLSSVSFS